MRAQVRVQSAKATREDASSSDARSAIYESEPCESRAKEQSVNQHFSISAGQARVTSLADQMENASSNASVNQAEPEAAGDAVDARKELVSRRG